MFEQIPMGLYRLYASVATWEVWSWVSDNDLISGTDREWISRYNSTALELYRVKIVSC